MKVCIAEKPSVAREIAKIIGASARKDGYFEGNGYCVTWTFGHFCELKTPDDYTPDWKKWSLNSLPMLPQKFETKLKKNTGIKKQFKIVKGLFKKANTVINCGDAGQEGELIQRWVMKQANYKGQVQRLWISSLTPEAIRAGFQNLRDAKEFDRLYYAGSSRAIGDWLLGMNATRLFTLKYGGYKQVLSIGRVQTPTLAMVVKRHKEIIEFVPEPYWELHTIYREVDFHYEKGRFQKQEDGETLLQRVTGKPFVILSSTKKNGKEYPPRLFDLTGLQVHCNKRFSYTAEQTLKIVQKLYEQKVVTYPRVDTTYLPNDVYPKVPDILSKMSAYSEFTQPLAGQTLRKSAKVFNDKKVTDHHAIIPTGYEKNLPQDEKNVYDAIARRFIAIFYPDCLVANTTVIGEVDGVKFKATGKEILEEGWRVLFPKKKNTDTENKDGKKEASKEDDEKILPAFEKGESGPHEPSLIKKMTKPPKYYTEATLLRAMETAGKQVDQEELRELMKENGIGRPSTRAAIIETLFRRKYIKRVRKLIHPTETGVQLIDTIQSDLLKSAELTGQWEKQLRDIEAGTHAPQQFIADMKTMITKLVDDVRMETGRPRIASPTKSNGFSKTKNAAPRKSRKKTASKNIVEATCPKCKAGKMLKGKAAYGCSRYKEGCNFRLPFKFMQKKLPELQLKRLLDSGHTILLKGFKEGKLKKQGKLKFNDNFELYLEEKATPQMGTAALAKKVSNKTSNTKKAPPPDCPKCKKGKVMRGKTAYGCSLWKEGCDFRYSFDTLKEKAAGRKLTRALVERLFKQGGAP